MKHYLLIYFALVIFACDNNSEQTTAHFSSADQLMISSAAIETIPSSVKMQPDQIQHITGYYVGYFEAVKYDEEKSYVYSNKINIAIDSLDDENIYGHSIVAGNQRPFSGPFQVKGDVYSALVKEPRNDRYDGYFEFELNLRKETLKGLWKAFDEKLPVSERKYELQKREFIYDPTLALPDRVSWTLLYEQNQEFANEGEFLTEDVLKLNPSEKLLTKEDVENMYKGDLEIIRNSIYARHGYSFKNRKIRFIFDHFVDWYIPVSTDVRDRLTSIEVQNIELIKRYEQHAEKYYDYFGR